jgi:ABC transporter substrate binding protein (PQQ-dependent alcohol dehydrogenase system)
MSLPRALAATLLLGAGLACAATLKATLLVPADDTRLERSRAERGYLGHPGGPAKDGLAMALEEGQFELDAAQAGVQVATQEAATLEAARNAAVAAEKAGAAVLLVDLPTDWLLAVTDAVKIPVLNLADAADRLRAQDCRARLFHLMPSERMRADALAQTLVSRKWAQLLLLVGPTPADVVRAATAEASIKRYGLKVVARKSFKLSADPRERDLANPLLLTSGASYDAVWVVDSDGEFARALPYRTVLPRPVVGDAGLVALAWHAQFERFGAPQVVRRFTKATKRPMTAHDWTAWMAGKALTAAAVAAPKGPNPAWANALAKAPVDGSKGVAMSFRAWDGQLRQPMLLTDGQGVIAQAPIDGLLHPSNVLDTLGADAPEKLCKVTR